MTKSDDCRIGIMIPRAPVPALRHLGRSKLYKTERDVGSDKNMTVSIGTDIGINIRCQACSGYIAGTLLANNHNNGHQERECYNNVFLSTHFILTARRSPLKGARHRMTPR